MNYSIKFVWFLYKLMKPNKFVMCILWNRILYGLMNVHNQLFFHIDKISPIYQKLENETLLELFNCQNRKAYSNKSSPNNYIFFSICSQKYKMPIKDLYFIFGCNQIWLNLPIFTSSYPCTPFWLQKTIPRKNIVHNNMEIFNKGNPFYLRKGIISLGQNQQKISRI